MYLKDESPVFDASIFYYDNEYDVSKAEEVFAILKKHSFFNPVKFYSDFLTQNRFVKYTSESYKTLLEGYKTKGVMSIAYKDAINSTSVDYCGIDWNFTFYKSDRLVVKDIKVKPWNILHVFATHSRIKKDGQSNFVSCAQEMVNILHPFYISIDDVDTRVENRKKPLFFPPYQLNEISWANYWNYSYFQISLNDLSFCLDQVKASNVGNGVYVQLSESILDYRSKKVNEMKRLISNRCLKERK